MSTVTSILSTDIISSSRGVINTNFANLNTDKLEGATVVQVLASTLSTVAMTPSVQGQIEKFVSKTSSSSVASSVLQADEHLIISVGANEKWEAQGLLVFDGGGSTLPDIKMSYSTPPGSDWNLGDSFGDSVFAPTNANNGQSSVINYGTSGPVGFNNMITHFGQFNIGSVAGSIALAWSQNVHAPSSVTTLHANSYLRFRRQS